VIALDASLAVEILAGSRTGATAADLLVNERLAVPAHFDAEVYSAFRRHFRRGLLTPRQLDRVSAQLVALAAERVALPPLLAESHALADRLSVGDTFYVALARVRRIELWTADARLERGATRLARVRLIT
jgi:predicted nucleic acid-binding protein